MNGWVSPTSLNNEEQDPFIEGPALHLSVMLEDGAHLVALFAKANSLPPDIAFSGSGLML